jgi:uncharacterized protein YeaO (DUF488 family)
MVKIKRVYDPQARGDGERILVDQLCPRGLSRRAAAVDKRKKDLGPSHELRKWFGHDSKRWRIPSPLRGRASSASARRWRRSPGRLRGGAVTLLFGARDPDHNQAWSSRA